MGDIDDNVKELYKAWANTILSEEGLSIEEISDIQDGKLLCALVDILDPSAKLENGVNELKEKDIGESSQSWIHEKILSYLKCEGIKTNVTANGLASRDIKQFLDLIWQLILHFTLHSKGTKLHQRTVKLAKKNLLGWCSTVLPHLQIDLQKSVGENLSDGKVLIELIGKFCNTGSQENCGRSLSDALATAEEEFGVKAQIISLGDFASGKGNEHAVLIYLALLKRKVEQMDDVGPHHRMPDTACNDKERVSGAVSDKETPGDGSIEEIQKDVSVNHVEGSRLEKEESEKEAKTKNNTSENASGNDDDGCKESLRESPLDDDKKGSWETSDLELELSELEDETDCDQTVIYCPDSEDSEQGCDSGKSETFVDCSDPDLIVEKYCKKSGAISTNTSPDKDLNDNHPHDKGCLSVSEDLVAGKYIRAEDEDSGVQSECSTVTRKSTESPPMETLRKDAERHDLGGSFSAKDGDDSCICVGLEETVLNNSDSLREGIEGIFSPLRKPPEESFECSSLSLCESLLLSTENVTEREKEISNAIRTAVLGVLQSMPRSVSEESIYRSMSSLTQSNMSASGFSTPFSAVGPPNEDLVNVLNQISQTSAIMCKELETQQSRGNTEGSDNEENHSEAGCIVTEEQKSQVIEVLSIEIDDLRVENGKLMQELVTEKSHKDADHASIEFLNKSVSSLKEHVQSLEKDKQSMQETVEKFRQSKEGPLMLDMGTVTDSHDKSVTGSQTLAGITIHRGSQTVCKSTSTSSTQYEKACALDIYTQTKSFDVGEKSTSTDDLPTQLTEETDLAGSFNNRGSSSDHGFHPLHRSSSISNLSMNSLDESFSLQKSADVIDRIMNQMSQVTSIEDAKEIAEAISAELDKKGYESEPECATKWQRLSMTPVSSDPKVLALQRSLASAMVENEILESKLKKAKKRIQRNTDELTSNLDACRDALKQVQSECEVLKVNFDAEQYEKLTFKTNMTNMQKELEDARQENERLTAKLERSMAMVKINLEAPKRAVIYEKENEELKEKLTAVTDLEEENKQLKENMEHITEEKENIVKEYERVKLDFSNQQESSQNFESKLSDAESEKNLLQSEVLVLRNEYNFLKKTVTNLEKVTKKTHPDEGAEFIRQARLESFDVFAEKNQQKDIILPPVDFVATSAVDRNEISPLDGSTIDLLTSESFSASLAPSKLDSNTSHLSAFDLQSSIDYSQELEGSTIETMTSKSLVFDEPSLNSKARNEMSVTPPPLSDGILSSSTLALLKLQSRNKKPTNPDDPREKVHQDIIKMSEQVLSSMEINGTKTPLVGDMIHWEDVRNSIAQRLADSSLVQEVDKEIETTKLKGLFQSMEKELGVESVPLVFQSQPIGSTEPVVMTSLPAEVPNLKTQNNGENIDGELSPDMAFQMQELAKTINTELGLKVKILPATPYGSPVSSPKRKALMERIGLEMTGSREKTKPRPDPNKLSENYEVLRRQRIQMLMKAFTGKDNPETYNPYLTAKLNSGSLNEEEQMMLVEDLKIQQVNSGTEKQETTTTALVESLPDSPKPYSKWLRKEQMLRAATKTGSEGFEKEQLLTELYRDVFEDKTSKSKGGYTSDTANDRKGKTYETSLRNKNDISKIRPMSASMDRSKARKETTAGEKAEYSDSQITSKYRRQIWPHKRNYAPPWLQEDEGATRESPRDHSDGYLSDGCILDKLSRSHIKDVLSEEEDDEDKGSTIGESILNRLKENEDSGKEFSAMRHFKSALQTRYGNRDREYPQSDIEGKMDKQYYSDHRNTFVGDRAEREGKTPQRSRDSLSLDRSHQRSRSNEWDRSRSDGENMRSYQHDDQSERDLKDLKGYRSCDPYSDDERGRSQYRKSRDRYKERDYMSDTGNRSTDRRSKDRRDGSYNRSWSRGRESDIETPRVQGDDVEYDLDITPTNMDSMSMSDSQKRRGRYETTGYYSDMDRRAIAESGYKERNFHSSESDRVLRDSTHKYNQKANTEDRHERSSYGIHSFKDKGEENSKPLDINELSKITDKPKGILKKHVSKDKALAAEVASIMKKYDQHMDVPSSNASSTASSKDLVVTLSGDIQKRSRDGKRDKYQERTGYRPGGAIDERIRDTPEERSRDRSEERIRNRSEVNVTSSRDRSEEITRNRSEVRVTCRSEERLRNMTDERGNDRPISEIKNSVWNHSCIPLDYEYKMKETTSDHGKSRTDATCTDPDCKLRHHSKSKEIPNADSYSTSQQQQDKYPREVDLQMEVNVDENNSSWGRHHHNHHHHCHSHHGSHLIETNRHDDKYSSTDYTDSHKHEYHHTPWKSEEFWTEPKKYEGDRLKNSGPSCNYEIGSSKIQRNGKSIQEKLKADDGGNQNLRDNRFESSKRDEKENGHNSRVNRGSSGSHFEHTILARKDMTSTRKEDGRGFMELTPDYSSSTEYLNYIERRPRSRDRQKELLDELYPLDKSEKKNSKIDDVKSTSRNFTWDKKDKSNTRNDHNLALRYEKRDSSISEQDHGLSVTYEPNIAVTITRTKGTETITSRGSSQSSVVDGSSDNEGYNRRGTTAKNGTSKKKRSVTPSNKARKGTSTSYQAKSNLKRDRSVAFANPEVSVKKDKSLSTAQQTYANTLIDRYALQWEKKQEETSGDSHPKYTMPQPRPTEEQKELADSLINKLEIHWQQTDGHQFENLSFTDGSRSEYELESMIQMERDSQVC